MITIHWGHREQGYVQGLNFLSLLYQLGPLSLPIAAVLLEKTLAEYNAKPGKYAFKSPFTKNEYLRQMLTLAQQQVQYGYLLAESWYAWAEKMNFVRSLNPHFLFALESSPTLALSQEDGTAGKFQALHSLTFPDKQPLKVYLRSVKQAVLVVRQVFINKDGSQGILYLVSSDTDLDYEQITTIYKRRWKVEEYHKSLKQNTSMGKSPTKTPDTQANHFYASMLAYIKLEALKLKCAIGHFQLKAKLYLAGLKAMQQQLNLLAA
jgi:hypothetical protein